ncbi:flippase-like domain-containing protein [Dactylosporangium sp. NPDC051541]|uniref:flippase-like domain-containing protein n=1 Tax=Dactylosporangium sp. NPDC051541 TaxID=3363977 RepID=UPI0037B71679
MKLRYWRTGLLVVGVVVGGLELRGHLPSPGATWATLRTAGTGWLAAAAALSIVAMVAFSEQQRQLLAAFGSRMGAGASLGLTYTRSAMAAALPAGSAVSAGYAFSRFRANGATRAVAAAVMLLSGAASLVGLALLYAGNVLVLARPSAAALGIIGAVSVAGVLGVVHARAVRRAGATTDANRGVVGPSRAPATAIDVDRGVAGPLRAPATAIDADRGGAGPSRAPATAIDVDRGVVGPSRASATAIDADRGVGRFSSAPANGVDAPRQEHRRSVAEPELAADAGRVAKVKAILRHTLSLAFTVSAGRWLAVLSIAVLNWLADLACLICAVRAAGLDVPATTIATGYLIAQLLRQIPATPGGIGVIEASLLVALTTAGAPAAPAAAAVLLYRILSCWIDLPVGLLSWRATKANTPAPAPATENVPLQPSTAPAPLKPRTAGTPLQPSLASAPLQPSTAPTPLKSGTAGSPLRVSAAEGLRAQAAAPVG